MDKTKEQNQLVEEVLSKTRGKLMKTIYKEGLNEPEDLEQELMLKLVEIVREEKIKPINFEEFLQIKQSENETNNNDE